MQVAPWRGGRHDRESVGNAYCGLPHNRVWCQMKGPITSQEATGPNRGAETLCSRSCRSVEPFLIIPLSLERKAIVPLETYDAIRRAVPIFHCDARVAAYAAAPHEGITPEIVGVIRARMAKRGELPARAYSRWRQSRNAR